MTPPTGTAVAAVDLGASSGRVMTARLGDDGLAISEVRRFPNRPVRVGGTLHWDVLGLYRGLLDGLRAAGPVAGIGIDSWAVDHGLLDASGALLGNPVHYRDQRTDGVAAALHKTIPTSELYGRNGLQELPFTTLYQLVAAAGSPQLDAARAMLLVPDLMAYWLTGERGTELTNASTTGLVDATTRTWALEIAERAGIDPALLGPLRQPGEPIGPLLPDAVAEVGYDAPVIAVGSHDTASAVVGVPARTDRFAYVATGTWSLVGVELDAPVLTDASRAANFTNELGVDTTVRYLRNVMGLWLLQECLRVWDEPDLPALLDAAAREPAFAAVVDADDPAFLPPGDMPARIAAVCRSTGQEPPSTRPAMVRTILESLALAHRRTVRQAVELSGKPVEVVHLVGGGARNELLCRLTADACGLPVVAGPVEAAAAGNALVQLRALGALHGDLTALRAALPTTSLRTYEPRGSEAQWSAAEARIQLTNVRGVRERA